jgi:hypothetical protein
MGCCYALTIASYRTFRRAVGIAGLRWPLSGWRERARSCWRLAIRPWVRWASARHQHRMRFCSWDTRTVAIRLLALWCVVCCAWPRALPAGRRYGPPADARAKSSHCCPPRADTTGGLGEGGRDTAMTSRAFNGISVPCGDRNRVGSTTPARISWTYLVWPSSRQWSSATITSSNTARHCSPYTPSTTCVWGKPSAT